MTMKAILYRCFYCDRTTAYAARVTLGANGKLTCHDCLEHDRRIHSEG
jgi:hypothetical protein